jgi:hypothetical protein
MLMYTSCGWFFDDLAGIETIQVLRYAGRAIQLAERRGAALLEDGFTERLTPARSNNPQEGDGAAIYQRHVRSIRSDLRQVGAHYAISALFNGYGDSAKVFCYEVERSDFRRLGGVRSQLALGRCSVRSTLTGETERQAFAVVHLGDHNLAAGVRTDPPDDAFDDMAAALSRTFDEGNLPACMNLLAKHLGPDLYSLPTLFRDQRQAVLSAILDTAIADVEASARRLYDQHAPLLRLLPSPNHPLSRALRAATEITLSADLREALAPEHLDLARAAEILAQSLRWGVDIDRQAIPFRMQQSATVIAEGLDECVGGREVMAQLVELVELAVRHGFDVDLWRAQNAFYRFMQRCYADRVAGAAAGEPASAGWLEQAHALGAALRVRVGEET